MTPLHLLFGFSSWSAKSTELCLPPNSQYGRLVAKACASIKARKYNWDDDSLEIKFTFGARPLAESLQLLIAAK
jgi:hypothetical protein